MTVSSSARLKITLLILLFVGFLQFSLASLSIPLSLNKEPYITQEGRPFEFSHLKARVDFCEGSSQVRKLLHLDQSNQNFLKSLHAG